MNAQPRSYTTKFLTNGLLLSKSEDIFKSVKNIIENSERFGWNKNLRQVFRLIKNI